MASVPTKRVLYIGGDDDDPVIINASDFDPFKHLEVPDDYEPGKPPPADPPPLPPPAR